MKQWESSPQHLLRERVSHASLSNAHFIPHAPTCRPLKQLQRLGLAWGHRALELVLSISLAFSQTRAFSMSHLPAIGIEMACENPVITGKVLLKNESADNVEA